MDYNKKIKGLIKEAFEFIQYKNQNMHCRIFLIVASAPLIAFAAVNIILYYILLFCYKAFSAPIDFLHNKLEEQGEKVKHATQVVIYFVGWPLVFLSYVGIALAAILFYFQWFITIASVYLATLGGVRWQPFINEAQYDDKKRKWITRPGSIGCFAYLVVFYGFFGLGLISIPLVYILSQDIALTVIVMMSVTVGPHFALLTIVNPILFRKKELLTEVVEE